MPAPSGRVAEIDHAAFWDHFVEEAAITLEETPDVVNIRPVVTADAADGFVVTDWGEGQVRLYGKHGALLGHAKIGTDTNFSLRRPLLARRQAEGGIMVVEEYPHSLAFLNHDASILTSRSLLTVNRLLDAVPLGRGAILLIGGEGPRADPRRWLHVWDEARQGVTHSFFTLRLAPAVKELAPVLGFPVASVRNDTIAAAFSLLDTLYLLTPDGTELSKTPLPLRGMTETRTTPEPRFGQDPGAILEDYVLLTDIFWLEEGGFLIQYGSIRGLEMETGLIHLGRNGGPIAHLRKTPRLLSVHGGRLYFIDPRFNVANRWVVGRLRQGSS